MISTCSLLSNATKGNQKVTNYGLAGIVVFTRLKASR